MKLPEPCHQIGIVGCGLIGTSWAALFVASGRNVFAWDPSPQAREGASGRVASLLAQLQTLALFPMEKPGNFAVSEDLSCVVQQAFFIQESAPEQLAIKHQLYRDIERVATPHTIIASSTSSFCWPELFSEALHPERCITAHPFNPPHLIPLVEIYGPSAEVVRNACDVYRSMGRIPVNLKKPAIGHIANRLASALWREAVNMVAEDIAGVEDIDAALVHGPGLRWSTVGAHMAYHLGGGPGGIEHYLKHLGPSQERRWSDLGNPRLTPEVCKLIVAGVTREADGRSVAALEKERDGNLIAILKSRQLSHLGQNQP
jgi:carnitine 3-dehydrogenase